MKKASIIALLILATVLGFFNTSWAVDRPNTPECVDVNGRSDPDACHIQYIEPLQKELKELWFQLVKLQGKKAEDNPWVFQTDNSACDQDKPEYYDEKTCKLSMPGKLAQTKHLIREEIKGLTYQAKAQRQKARLADLKQKLVVVNKELADKDQELTKTKKENEELLKQVTILNSKLAESNKIAEDQKKRADGYPFLSNVFVGLTILVSVLLGTIFIFKGSPKPKSSVT